MAVKEVIEIEAKTGKAEKELEKLSGKVDELTKSQQETAKATNGIASSIGTLTKGALIGVAIKAFESFTEVLGRNQKVADFFSTALEFVSIAFNDLVNYILNNTQPVLDTFKAIFENPVESLKSLGDAIKNNLIERFNSFVETLGFVGDAVSALFSGDFALAGELAKEAGKEMVDVFTGVDGTVDKVSETIDKGAEAITKYAKETYEAAEANVQLSKSAEIAAVRNQGLIEEYDRQAEAQRQIRDDERNSLEDRRKANDELAKILEKQKKEMLENAQIAVDAANAELAKNKDNQDAIVAKLEAENELAAIKAQIKGFESEQQANDMALDREEIELIRSKKETQIDAFETTERARIDALDSEQKKLWETAMLEQELYNRRKQLLEDQIKNEKEGSTARAELENELDTLKAEYAAGEMERNKNLKDFNVSLKEQQLQAEIALAQGALGVIAQFAEEGSALAKSVAVAQTTIATYESAVQAYKSTVGIPVVGTALAPIAAGVAIAGGLAQVRNILATDPMGGSGSVSSSGYGRGSTVSANTTAPSFNIVAATQQTRLLNDINAAQGRPARAYVVSKDVSTAQELERNRIKNAKF